MKKSKKVKLSPKDAIKQLEKALANVELTVTKSDIKNGDSGSSSSCPIALAAKRAFGINDDVNVGSDGIEVVLNGYVYSVSYDLPERAKEFIENFDNDEKVKPFTFVAKQTS